MLICLGLKLLNQQHLPKMFGSHKGHLPVAFQTGVSWGWPWPEETWSLVNQAGNGKRTICSGISVKKMVIVRRYTTAFIKEIGIPCFTWLANPWFGCFPRLSTDDFSAVNIYQDPSCQVWTQGHLCCAGAGSECLYLKDWHFALAYEAMQKKVQIRPQRVQSCVLEAVHEWWHNRSRTNLLIIMLFLFLAYLRTSHCRHLVN